MGPGHFREMALVAWENRDQIPFAWRILKRGVCDGCALGTSGLSDWTIRGDASLHGPARLMAPSAEQFFLTGRHRSFASLRMTGEGYGERLTAA
jgi:hypothetical protein